MIGPHVHMGPIKIGEGLIGNGAIYKIKMDIKVVEVVRLGRPKGSSGPGSALNTKPPQYNHPQNHLIK